MSNRPSVLVSILALLAPGLATDAASLISQSREVEAEAHFTVVPGQQTHAYDSMSAEDFGPFDAEAEAIAAGLTWGKSDQVSSVSTDLMQAACTVEVSASGNLGGISGTASAASHYDVSFEVAHATDVELAASSQLTIDEGSWSTHATVRLDGPGGQVFLMEADALHQNVAFLQSTMLTPGAYTLSAVIETGVCGCPDSFYAHADVSLELILTSRCPADIVADGQVGFHDLVGLLMMWGACDECSEDLSSDGHVGFADLSALLMTWGPCPE